MSMDFSDNATHITGVTGTHASGKTNNDVKLVNFHFVCWQYQLNLVPTGLQNYFQNFIAINFDDCLYFDDLKSDALATYPNLEWFGFFKTKVKRIPGTLFESNAKLKFAGFSNNIMSVAPNLFNTTSNIEIIWFLESPCIDSFEFNRTLIPAFLERVNYYCPDCEVYDIGVETFSCRLKRDFLSVKTIVDNLDTTVNVLKTDVNVLSTNVNTLNSTINSMKTDITDMKSSVNNLNYTINSMQTDMNFIKNDVNNQASVISYLEDTVSSLNFEVEALKMNHNNLNATVNILLSNNNALRTDVDELIMKNANLTAENYVLKNIISDLVAEMGELKDSNEILKASNEILQNKVYIHTEALAIIEAEILWLKSSPCAC